MPYMQHFFLGFCGGAMVLAAPWPAGAALPGALAAAALVVLVVILVWSAVRARPSGWRRLAYAGFPLGLVWSGFAHDAALTTRLQDGGRITATVTGRVLDEPVDLPAGRGGIPAQRFEALVTGQRSGAGMDAVGTRVRLSWYGGPRVGEGEIWQWTVVLSGPWSYANPGGFDYERWLLGAGLQGTGYVKSGERLRAVRPRTMERARHAVAEQVRALELQNGSILLALLVGDGGGIPEATWNALRATGTVHLMVISGLHVSLAAALGFAAGRWLGSLCPLLPLAMDARIVGCISGAGVALVYVLLAGAGLPAVRALAMSGATLALLARGRTGRLGGGLLIALTAVLAMEPLAIHHQGFWLSFGAVAMLYLALGHRHGSGRLGALLRGQLALSLGMLPLVALVTEALPWTGVPANLVAVPVMSLVVVPAVLLGAAAGSILPDVGGWLMWLADAVVGGVLGWLDWLAVAPLPASGGALTLLAAQAAAVGWILGTPRKYLPGLILCWALPFAAPVMGVAHGEFRVMAMDVGQGDAIAIDTHRHRLLYDAGPAFPSGFETGTAVVAPSLRETGPARLDVLILSHDDVDHVGGAEAVIARFSPSVLVSVPGPQDGRAATGGGAAGRRLYCHGRRWQWDGVEFTVLQVARPAGAADNDLSCILLVDNGRLRVLVAGDIGSRIEALMLRELADAPVPIHLMFAPHHGSLTSSSRALVRVLRPSIVLVSAGRGNRFGHPHPEVVRRYRAVGARLYQTGIEGALIWQSSNPHEVLRWRPDRGAYWRERDAGGSDSSR